MGKTLFLFTKKFPYSHQETYLFDELPYLLRAFQKVIIVPYDEYKYDENENRLINNKSIEIYKINQKKYTLGLRGKIKREFNSLLIISEEFLYGREKLKQIKNFKHSLYELRHLYSLSINLLTKINKEKYKDNSLVFYNYWLHRGVLISHFTRKRLDSSVKIISRAHAYDLYHDDWLKMLNINSSKFLPFEFVKLKSCDHIYSISSHGLTHFSKLFKSFNEKISVSRLGVNEQIINSSQHVNNDFKLIVTCSGTDDRKRVYLMPSILSKLNFNFKWVHIGAGKKEDFNKIEKEITKYCLENYSELKGQLPHDEIISFYKQNHIDLFLNLSTAEGIPFSLMEAASFGIPMVATNTVGNPEIVNNENGFLIDVDFNTNDLAMKLNEFFSNPVLVAKKRQASKETFLKHYNATKNYPEFIDSILLDK